MVIQILETLTFNSKENYMKKTLLALTLLASTSAFAAESFICSVNKLSDSSNKFTATVGKTTKAGKLNESGKYLSLRIADMDKSGDDSMFKGQYAVTAWISDSKDASPMNNIEYISTTIGKTQKVVQLQAGSGENHTNVFCQKK